VIYLPIAKTSNNSTNFSKVTSNSPDKKRDPHFLKNLFYKAPFFGKKKSALWQEVVGLPAG